MLLMEQFIIDVFRAGPKLAIRSSSSFVYFVTMISIWQALMIGGVAAQSTASNVSPIVLGWVDGWNSSDPEKLAKMFTSDGIYQDVPTGLNKKGGAEIRDLHIFFHNAVEGLYVKLIAANIAGDHGTIEWLFGGKDIGIFKTGKPFEVQGVSVVDLKDERISRDFDYYDMATIMKQVGVLPAK
jgi:uncharacterized protein (TIGR02246 family)